jgi:hypothetical protein
MFMGINYPDSKNKNSFQNGMEFQDFVADVLRREMGIVISNYSSAKYQFNVGENRQGIEIKLDKRILETGNISIEIAEKSKEKLLEYTPSGIMRNDNSWLYLQGNYDILFIFAKKILISLYNARKYRIDDLPTIRRFLLPLQDAEKYAAKVLRKEILTAHYF